MSTQSDRPRAVFVQQSNRSSVKRQGKLPGKNGSDFVRAFVPTGSTGRVT